jgi:hypothetical protein
LHGELRHDDNQLFHHQVHVYLEYQFTLNRMKNIYLTLLVFIGSASYTQAQDGCVDASVIDPSMECLQMGIPGVYCGCDGAVYASQCEAYYVYGVVQGQWSITGGCDATVDPGDCIDPTLIDPTAVCDMMYAPVCGCDGNTYSNECVATSNGVLSWVNGECGSTATCSAYFYYNVQGDGYTVSFNAINADGTISDPSQAGGEGASPTASYFWTFGDGTTSDEFAPVHIYSDTSITSYWACLTVTDTELDCSDIYSDSVYVGYGDNAGCVAGFNYGVSPDGTVVVYPDSTVSSDPSNPAGSWYWQWSDGSVVTDSSFVFPVDSVSTDSLCMVVVNGACYDVVCVGQQEIYASFIASGIHENAESQPLRIWPNPANGLVRVSATLPSAGTIMLEVVDVMGRIVMLQNATTNGPGLTSISLDMSEIPAGIYRIRLNHPSVQFSGSVVVQ